MPSATTRNIEVSVETSFLEKDSDPADQYFVWAYRITITNHSDESVQLVKRHWQITDAMGRMQEVKGDGVVGEQPVIKPGGSFVYSSGTPLGTASGFMRGSYQVQDPYGAGFDIEIPAFSLDSPHDAPQLH